jgi:uncharacterized protein YjbI with pentapeptide repeats
MSNPKHVELLSKGKFAVRQWITANPGTVLDWANMNLASRDLSELDLSRANLKETVLQACNLTNATLRGADLTRAQLSDARLNGADLKASNLHGANLNGADLTAADLRGANCTEANLTTAILTTAQLDGAVLKGANLIRTFLRKEDLRDAKLAGARLQQLSLEEIDLSGQDLTETKFEQTALSRAHFDKARLPGASFSHSQLLDAIFDGALLDRALFQRADLTRASLVAVSMRHASLEDANLTDANLDRADFFELHADLADFTHVRGLTRAVNLHTVRLSPNTVRDVRNFETVLVPFLEKTFSWERIRFLGRLSLFGASYSALVAIPFLYYLFDIFNRKVDVIRAWATQEVADNGVYGTAAQAVLNHLHREQVPTLSLLLLISTILLGIGATIFALLCPTRVREFSRDQWCDQFGHSLVHYWPLAWRHRRLRVLCIVLYAVGGAGVVAVLVSKLWNVFWFIVENS